MQGYQEDDPVTRSTSVQVHVGVEDINDQRPEMEMEVYSVNISEHAARTSVLTTVSALDRDIVSIM